MSRRPLGGHLPLEQRAAALEARIRAIRERADVVVVASAELTLASSRRQHQRAWDELGAALDALLVVIDAPIRASETVRRRQAAEGDAG